MKVLRVHSEDAPLEDVATISYAWNERPGNAWSIVTADVPNPFLDPLHRQATYAEELLDFWRAMIASDPRYVDRLERHYHELRSASSQRSENARLAFRSESADSRRPLAMPSLTKPERRARQRRLQQLNRARKRQ